MSKFLSVTKLSFLVVFLCAGLVYLAACSSDDDDDGPDTGKLKGLVSDGSTTTPLSDASIVIYNANDNAPWAVTTSDGNGNYEIDLEPGSYFIRTARQGYLSVPAPSLTAVPFTIEVGATLQKDVLMFAHGNTDIGFISGKVTDGGNTVAGVLVTAENGEGAFSAISDQNGAYKIFNVTAGTYAINGWLAGYNSDQISVNVSATAETKDSNVTLSASGSGTLSGQVRNISVENVDVDVALVHPRTRETIPGLTGRTLNQIYEITGIPDGTFIARATFENDMRVLDPDRIFKFGEPEVTITSGSTESIDFDITGSVTLNNPTNEATTTAPVELTSTVPTFSWTAYSSTSDYVIEVTDATTGTIVWGGINTDGPLPEKNIIIPSNTLSIAFNEDGQALINQLEIGKVYRWRIYASKNDQNSDTGWTLISASEDQRGLIKIVE